MVRESFKIFVKDQLSDMKDLLIKRMFGGCGLYESGYFFGILAQDRVYFKTNEITKKKYEKMKMKPFCISEKQILKNYFEVPVDILEDSKRMNEWACEAIEVSKSQGAFKK
jgi:DNA transformation protein